MTQGESMGRAIGGLPSVANRFEAQAQSGPLRGVVGFVEHRKSVFQILAYTRENRWRELSGRLAEAVESFGPVAERRLHDVEPKRLGFVTLDRPMTIEEFARSHPSTVEPSTLAIINQVESGQTIPARTRLKRFLGGELPR